MYRLWNRVKDVWPAQSRGWGLEDADGGVKLICLGCKAAEVLTFEGARLCWQEQMRRDRVLALAGIVPDGLKRP